MESIVKQIPIAMVYIVFICIMWITFSWMIVDYQITQEYINYLNDTNEQCYVTGKLIFDPISVRVIAEYRNVSYMSVVSENINDLAYEDYVPQTWHRCFQNYCSNDGPDFNVTCEGGFVTTDPFLYFISNW